MKLPCENCLVLPFCKQRIKHLLFIERLNCDKIDSYLRIEHIMIRNERKSEFKKLMGLSIMTGSPPFIGEVIEWK